MSISSASVPLASRTRQARARETAATTTIRYGLGSTPIGLAMVATTDVGVCSLCFLDGDDPRPALDSLQAEFPGAPMVEDEPGARAILAKIAASLNEGRDCADLALDVRGTPFQRRVWDALRAIPRGTTRTYGELARELGIAGAARAVGSACGSNPVALLIPCHRVVAANGGLGGFHWGLDRKRALLDLERPRV